MSGPSRGAAMTTPANPADQQGTRPVPDPTVLTTEALRREIENLNELIKAKLSRLEDLCDEKFAGVEDKLSLGERQRVEQKTDTEKAIQAALLAQQASVAAQAEAFEKSVAKSELATDKRLDQLQNTFQAENRNLVANQDDLKARVGKMEAVRVGSTESRAGLYGALAAAVGIIIAVVAVINIVLA